MKSRTRVDQCIPYIDKQIISNEQPVSHVQTHTRSNLILQQWNVKQKEFLYRQNVVDSSTSYGLLYFLDVDRKLNEIFLNLDKLGYLI